MYLKTDIINLEIPKDCNIILGMSHFIKTVEDLEEILEKTVPEIKYGLAFCEASGPCLIRRAGSDKSLEDTAIKNIKKIGAGHSFIIILKDTFPIQVLQQVKRVEEVCTIYCATANPVQVIVAETEQGRGILGVIDGNSPKGIEGEKEIKERKEFLRKIGYKL